MAIGGGSPKSLQVVGVDSQQLKLLGGTAQFDSEPSGVAADHILAVDVELFEPLPGGLKSAGPFHSSALRWQISLLFASFMEVRDVRFARR